MLPSIGLWRLDRQKASITGVRAGNLFRLNMFFLSAIVFDMLRNLSYSWAAYGENVSAGLVFSVVGLAAASLCFCPDCNTLREAWSRLKSRTSLLLYEGVVFAGIGLNLFLPNSFLPFTIVLLSAGTVYPTTLFLLARRRAKPPHIRNAMATLAITWPSSSPLAHSCSYSETSLPCFP